MELADAAARLGKVKGCPAVAEDPKAGELPKGVLLPIALLPKGILRKGPLLVIPKPPLLAAEVVLLLLEPADENVVGLTAVQGLRGFKPWV